MLKVFSQAAPQEKRKPWLKKHLNRQLLSCHRIQIVVYCRLAATSKQQRLRAL